MPSARRLPAEITAHARGRPPLVAAEINGLRSGRAFVIASGTFLNQLLSGQTPEESLRKMLSGSLRSGG